MKCLIAVPTFKRPKFLGRVLACFDRLDYNDKKMVIINDDPDTKLIYNGDLNVDIINIDKHLPLAVKRNLFACWDFDVLHPLDDDDLFLPDRLTNHAEQYDKNPDIDLYRNIVNYVATGKQLKISSLLGAFTNSSFTRKGYFKSGGYTNFNRSNHDDVSLRKNFKSRCNCKIEKDFTNVDFIYQFDGGRYHNTYNQSSIMGEIILQRSTNQNKMIGDITLTPDWDTYDDIVNIINESDNFPKKIKIIDNIKYVLTPEKHG